MDAFYASVEQRDNPALRGKPVAVGGDPTKRGVVAAASYEARAFGVRSAIPMSRAVRLCPSLIIVRPDFQKYRTVSQQVFAIYRSVTPLVEPLSLDEAYLDVTENRWHEALGVSVAKRIKAAIRETTGLTASAGVAPNKFLAKIASGWHKPDGLTVIAPERVETFLQSLPVDALWGVGPKTAERLRAHGIAKLVDVRARALDDLRAIVGSSAAWLRDLSLGHDSRVVDPNEERKSVGSECTYETDLTDLARIRAEIDEMARDAARWLDKNGMFARTVVIKVRYEDFTTITRSQSDLKPTREADAIASRAVALLDKTDAGRRPVRLLGVSVHNLEDSDAARPRRHARLDDSPRLPLDED
jgi:DNA polymerase-4